MSTWLRVQYSCPGCKILDREITVPARQNPDQESVTDWMKKVVQAIANDHHLYRPACHTTKMDNLKIPIEDDNIGWKAEWIGQAK